MEQNARYGLSGDELILSELLDSTGWPQDDLHIISDEEGVLASLMLHGTLLQFRLVAVNEYQLVSLAGQDPPADLPTSNLTYQTYQEHTAAPLAR